MRFQSRIWSICAAPSYPIHASLTIRFLFVTTLFCHQLPSDSTSRWTPLLRLVLPPRRGAQRTFTSKLVAMLGAHLLAASLYGLQRFYLCGTGAKRAAQVKSRLQRSVYAQHGHVLMSGWPPRCKSPVGGSPLNSDLTRTTSEWQGPNREEWSRGSR